MTDAPGFDPYQVLGVGLDADVIAIQLAFKARIREVHPDIAGAAGLEQTKRLNAARDWLLDPDLRARLRRPPDAAPQPGAGRTRTGPRPERRTASHGPPPRHAAYDRFELDPDTFDFGPRTDELRAFLRAIGALTRDERARVNYSLGDARPVFFEGYSDYFGPQLRSRSRALRAAVSLAWDRGVDEAAPFVFALGHVPPSGFLVANAYAQWMLLGDFFRLELGDALFRTEHVLDSFAARCTGPWQASVRQARYGPHDQRVRAFLGTASTLSVDAAGRLARSWRQLMGRDGLGDGSDHIGPGVWLPTPPGYPEILAVSGYLAAVDASRIEPPPGLERQHHSGHRYGLRLTAHVLALGLVNGAANDYLRPWRDATSPDSFGWGRSRWRMSVG